MTKLKDNYTINDILETVRNYLEPTDLIKRSYEYTINLYPDIDKKTVLNVANILTTLQADEETIAASFLHHLFNEDLISFQNLEKEFDSTLVRLAYGIYKLNKISFSTANDYLVEYYKKVIVGMSEDVRVIIVTLAERVYLMRTLYSYSVEDQKTIANETLEIFAPISHHLGIYKLKSELEDLSLRYLKPDVYYDIVEKLNGTKTERDNLINEMIKEVSDILNEHDIKHEIKGRSKSIYSIYNKLDKGRKFSDIYDLLALRILVQDDATCYLVLGLIHSRFKPIAKRFKDFIAMPKSNGYQSLHTTVFGVENELYEIQIRTYDMNEVAENGLAAHWSYKEHRNAVNLSSTDEKLEFFKAVIDSSKNNEYDNFNPLHDDDLENNIYVFTPKGDVIELPKGSTPVDFAYKVHTKIGDSMVGALVNNQIVPLNYELQDSDVIKINTSKLSSGPSEDWLNFVKLNSTKSKIKNFFSKTRKDDLISNGKQELEKELRKRKISINDFYTDENVRKVLKELKLSTLEELYIDISGNKYSPKFVIGIIYDTKETEEIKGPRSVTKNELDINVSGLTDIRVNIASCCQPIPGDEIVGYITRNNGITIHRKSCSNLLHLDERMVDVSFNPVTKNKYLTSIKVILCDDENRLVNIVNNLVIKNVFVQEIKTFYHDNTIGYLLSFYVPNLEYLEKLIAEIKQSKYVKEVERI